MGGKSSSAVRYPWLPRRSLANRLLIRPAPVQDLLLCAKHLFVAAMAAKVHPGLPGIGKSEHDGAAVRVPEPWRFMGSKSKAPLPCALSLAN
jgi:hypothetical protein